jgi:D-alanine-D-alanine ligase
MTPAIVLFGGSSPERRVSVASAQSLTAGLPEARYWFWEPDGSVVQVDIPTLTAHKRPFEVDFVPSTGAQWASLEAAFVDAGMSAFLLALHGGTGEDGTVQLAFESRGIAFTGSGSEASALAMDKPRAKLRVAEQGVSTPKGSSLVADGELAARLLALFDADGPLVVKPASSGSSVGLAFVHGRDDVAAASRDVELGTALLVEQLILGREVTVGVMETLDGEVKALPCSEVRVAKGRSFDYEGKYLGKGTEELTPADLPPDVFRECQGVAVRCHRALGCRGYSRTDLILSEGGPVFLETNTLPGLTSASFIPQQLRAAGIPIESFLQTQLELAQKRAALAHQT